MSAESKSRMYRMRKTFQRAIIIVYIRLHLINAHFIVMHIKDAKAKTNEASKNSSYPAKQSHFLSNLLFKTSLYFFPFSQGHFPQIFLT